MAKRMSNRDRIQRKAIEAAKTEEEKAASEPKAKAKTKKKTKAKAKKKTASAEKSGVRLKVVWKVYNPLSKEVATFPYPEREKAEKKAAELTKKHGKEYTVRDDKVPME